MRARALAPLALGLIVGTSGCQAASPPAGGRAEYQAERQAKGGDRADLGVMTSLPILWRESADFADLLTKEPGDGAGWVRRTLAARHALVPIDTLEDGTLRGLPLVLLAQPRPLSPAENVALDRWVRGGGRLLLFADPMLTAHTRYPVGDKRRPQDVALLSPILRHWGLEMIFDEAEPGGPAAIAVADISVPVEMAGRLRGLSAGTCRIAAVAVLAECPLGKGRVTVFADAALLDEDAAGADPAPHQEALNRLLARAFD